MSSSYAPSWMSTPLPAAARLGSPSAPPSASPSRDSDSPITAAPIVKLHGLRDPLFGGKLDARIADESGVSLGGTEDPLQRRRDVNVGFYEGPLKLEAARATQDAEPMHGASSSTTLGTQLLWSKTSLWSRYSPDGRTLGFGLSRPIATGISLSTQWTESLFERRIMFGIDADPTAAWKLLRDAVR